MKKTGIVKDMRYLDHDMGFYHPESPERLEAIYKMLEKEDMRGNFHDVPVRMAERDELLMIHSPEYINMIESTDGKDSTYLDPDTRTSPGSYCAALLAAGGLCEAISMVNSGQLDNAFALVRPPGHHAESNRAMGFCIFNNIGIGAQFARKHLGLRRILIVDWDLHHGNGTQHSFEKDPFVLYFSTHQYPFYPGTGSYGEIGSDKGEGYTINIPLSSGYGDSEYLSMYEKILRPVALEFEPDFILVSAGFDIYAEDPLGGMKVTPKGFAGLTRIIMEIAATCCQNKLVMTLEGGYHIEGERDSVESVLKELADINKTDFTEIAARGETSIIDFALRPVIKVQRQYWKSL